MAGSNSRERWVVADPVVSTTPAPCGLMLVSAGPAAHHENLEGQAKVPSPAFLQLLLSLTPVVSINWCQPRYPRGFWQWQVWCSTSTSVPAHQQEQGFTVGLSKQVTCCLKTPSPHPELPTVRGRREKEQNCCQAQGLGLIYPGMLEHHGEKSAENLNSSA